MTSYRSIEGGLSDADLRELNALVELPSWYDSGKKIDERAIAQFIEGRLQNSGCDVWRMPVDERRFNIVATKGDGDEFVLWVTGHMDTDEPDSAYDIGCRLEQDSTGDRLQGVGVWDMKAGLLQMLKLAREVEVPPGMKMCLLFEVDEESESKGMRAALEHKQLPDPDFVISPEIPTVPESKEYMLEGGSKHPIVVARRGHLKFVGNTQVRSGHGCKTSAPNAITVYREVMNVLFQQMYGRKVVPFDEFCKAREDVWQQCDADEATFRECWQQYLENNRPEHPLLSLDDVRESDVSSGRKKNNLSVKTRVDFAYSHLVVTPTGIEDALNHHLHIFRAIHSMRKYDKQGIAAILGLDSSRTHYRAYSMDTENPVMCALARSVDAESGKPHVFTGGESTSDMNLIAAKGFLGAEVAGVGGNEHSDHEWVSSRGTMRNFKALRRFITQELPEALG